MYWKPVSRGLLVISAFLLHDTLASASCNLSARQENGTQGWTESSWGTLEPSNELKWVPCYTEAGGFQCTRLEVPLDYNNPGGDKAAIALIRLPANVSSDSQDYRGPILFNPGGPGGSGVDYVLGAGASHQVGLGPQFDIVGFDPRGVRRSTPRIEFYGSREERILSFRSANELNQSRESVESFWAKGKIMGTLAYERGKDYLGHMNTANSARDMLSIVEAHGQEKLQYWGFSYGSVLGYTFAAMLPDKVERLIIDGVVEIEDYYRTRWINLSEDSEKAQQRFFEKCKDAGPQSCDFYEDSIEAMESKLQGIYARLDSEPVPVRTNVSYGVIDYGFFRPVLLEALYAPFAYWRRFATGLQALVKGDGEVLWKIFEFENQLFECDCDEPGKHAFEANPEAQVAYVCNDGDAVPPGVDATRAFYKEAVELYSSWGTFRSSHRMACSGWSPEIPKAQFRGPISGNTSFPMLIIGNTAGKHRDPATPLSAAKKASQQFPGSVVLEQNSAGHGSVAAPSVCTTKIVREYFVNGTLPENGTVCPEDGSPFDDPPATNATSRRDLLSMEDVELASAAQDLARKYSWRRVRYLGL
ncbi:hypothetical protein AAF712_015444 [Marasmius tenuissimus]|uniref:Uncharacterized protein n=1 Tax=Marasmius tenuissimus TaxID=585030 RepID=A0ABR2Z984_9AGAR